MPPPGQVSFLVLIISMSPNCIRDHFWSFFELLANIRIVPEALVVTGKEHSSYAWERKEPTKISR